MDLQNQLTLLFVAILVLAFFARRFKGGRPPYPRGPRPLPIIGNLLDLPTKEPSATYTEWGNQYGAEVLYARALGKDIIIINSREAAIELLEKRAHIYSSRPHIPMLDLLGWANINTALLPYGDLWRRHRRILHEVFRPHAASGYQVIQTKKIHDTVRAILDTPEDFMEHIRTLSAAIIMSIMYDYDVSATGDRFVNIAEEAVEAGAHVIFSAHAANAFPILRYLPSWFPGGSFHKAAEHCRKLTAEMTEAPYHMVRRKMATGMGTTSVLGNLLQASDAQGGSSDQEEVIMGVSMISYAAGADTTVSAMNTLMLAMTLYPDVQRKAQHEIDTVIGSGRLPTYSDRPSLPYIEAIYREILRWRPVAPLGLPHATTEDDVYQGQWIPKGATVISNIWAMTHNEAIYERPDEFMPDRFFDENGKLNDDDRVLAYGFGRRACAGRYLASSSVWLFAATVLASFHISKSKDENGQEIIPDKNYTDGSNSHPRPFKCTVAVRSAEVKGLVEATKDA